MINMSYLKDKPIAVLGGGASARGHAACAAHQGREVRLYELPEFFDGLGSIKENKEIRLSGLQESLYGFKREGLVELNLVTDNIKKAVRGAGIIIISFPAVGNKAFLEKLIPYLEDGMVIHFTSGNFGSLMMKKMMREIGCDKKIVIGEWHSQPFGIRIKISGRQQFPEVNIVYWAITLRGSAMPMTDQEAFFESKKYIPSLDSVIHPVAGNTVIDIGFTNANPVLHVPGTILGISTMENWGLIYGQDKYEFSIYSHAFCPSISEVQKEMYKEVCQIAEAIGVGIQHYEDKEFFSRSNILGSEHMGPNYIVPFNEQYKMLMGTGPFTIYNRYITEDVPVGCHVYYELAKKFNVKVPIIKSMITLASVMTKTDYWKSGLTLEELGIAHLSKEELLTYLHEGKYQG